MWWNLLLLIAGFTLLIKGSDVFVDANVGIARYLRIPPVIVALTIISIGTGAPEVAITTFASVGGQNDLAISNIVGSNMFNLFFIIGLCALIKPFNINFHIISKDFWVSICVAVLFLFVIIITGEHVPRYVTIGFILIYIGYIAILIRRSLKNRVGQDVKIEEGDKAPKPMWLNIVLAVISCGVIVFGASITVANAEMIAEHLGMTTHLIGLTVVAAGTSLPELVIALMACKKGETPMALGTVVGSNIFNILMVLGIAGTISPLEIGTDIRGIVLTDLCVLAFGSLLSLFFVYSGRRLARPEGAIMVTVYFGYMLFVIISQI
ncbi:MAG: calcium/sodium antiporter [Defluviitaleaceae bacterium]|nr:calcium/sodium antiporter [Defluviitaleaceae bacterium]